jgi:MerR family transcriptional regulator/heat shock protein HspR
MWYVFSENKGGLRRMAEIRPDKFEVDIDPDAPLFIISVVSDMVDMPVWTIRKLDEMGIIKAERIGKKTRCYSKKQIKKLNYVHFLMEEKGINISGIKFILETEEPT